MGYSKLKKFHERSMEELEGMYKDGPLDAAKIPVMKDLAKLTFYLGKICDDCEMKEGYSQTGNSYRGQARDSMGRFSGNGSYYSGTGYSGNQNGMSRTEAKDVITHGLGNYMACTDDPFIQSVLTDTIQRIQNH